MTDSTEITTAGWTLSVATNDFLQAIEVENYLSLEDYLLEFPQTIQNFIIYCLLFFLYTISFSS